MICEAFGASDGDSAIGKNKAGERERRGASGLTETLLGRLSERAARKQPEGGK